MHIEYRALSAALVSVLAMTFSVIAAAQTIGGPNPSFESGSDHPDSWTLDGEGAWLSGNAASGQRAVSVIGAGETNRVCRSDTLPLKPGTVYRLRFRARNLDGNGGTAVSGPPFCNRDLGSLAPIWEAFTSYFVTPDPLPPDASFLRFGEWHVNGALAFDDIELTTAEPIYHAESGVALGDGERIEGNLYTFEPNWNGTWTNQSRPLAGFRGAFNTNRWNLEQDNDVVYRQRIGDRRQLKASVEVTVTNYSQGALKVQAGADGKAWKNIGSINADGAKSFELPSDLLPAPEIWVRLRAAGPSAFSFSGYRYTATLEGPPLHAFNGSTRFAVITSVDPRITARITGLGDGLPGGKNEIALDLLNTSNETISAKPNVAVRSRTGETYPSTTSVNIAPGDQSIRIPYQLTGAGSWDIEIDLGDAVHYAAEATVNVPELHATNYGERLPDSTGAVGLWWASSGWKISRTRPVPSAANAALRISLARNETEAAQFVLRPKSGLKNLTLTAVPLSGPSGAVIPATSIEILREHYLQVQQATDSAGAAGLWPDPLPPLAGPITLEADVNQPFWVRVKAPKGIAAGVYTGAIKAAAGQFAVDIPVAVTVFDFDLPDRMTCVSAFGFSPGNVYKYQKLDTPEQKRVVIEKYLANFSAHHITPYNPAPLDAFDVQWPAATAATPIADLKPTIDWTKWDAAMDRAYSEYHFNSFQLPEPGMGGGTFHNRVEPELQGFKEGTPQYQALFTSYYQQVQDHLRAKGWLNDAYVYWFDEPDPKDYEFVMNGFRKLKAAAPGIPRMLTEQVEPQLVDGPNLWCPISNEYKQAPADERRAQGERFWWYICTGPKAPYCTEFIDHPATELRVWLWQTWQRNINGILIWQSNYWTSGTAYADPAHPQNPYDDPMSWTVGYGTPAGARIPWGNGDGRFIYPPEAAAAAQLSQAVTDGPVDSIRWELLRDGVEDYEYMAILKALIEKHRSTLSDADRTAYKSLLIVPDEITANVTTFTKDPKPIEVRRDAIARAIEKLSAQKP